MGDHGRLRRKALDVVRFPGEEALGDQALGKQFKLADARGVKAVVVVGPDDRARGEVVVKDLAEGSQRSVPRGDVAPALRALGAGSQQR